MSQYFQIHPQNPQPRLLRQAVQILRQGGLIAYPTDSAYALGCRIDDKAALDRLRRVRRLDDDHLLTLLCCDLSALATYAKVDNRVYRLLKAHTPGPYTFILPATSEVPRRLHHPKRRTIGLRIPDHIICQALLAELGEPMLTTTLYLPGVTEAIADADELESTLRGQVDLIIDGGHTGVRPTTVIDLSEGVQILREGAGDTRDFIQS